MIMIIMDNNDNDNGNRNKEIHGVIKPGCTICTAVITLGLPALLNEWVSEVVVFQ